MPRKTAIEKLIGLVAHLRSPKGCPWDRKQTHLSLIRYLREEAEELERALRKGSWHEIEDELGDVLLQILLHAQIARERDQFDIQDVAKSQYLKLKRRHPHVFNNSSIPPGKNSSRALWLDDLIRGRLPSAGTVKRLWKRIKEKERRLRRKDIKKRLRKLMLKKCPKVPIYTRLLAGHFKPHRPTQPG